MWTLLLAQSNLSIFQYFDGGRSLIQFLFTCAVQEVTQTRDGQIFTGKMLSVILGVLVLRDGLFTRRFLIAALIVAVVFHILEVGHNVFKRW